MPKPNKSIVDLVEKPKMTRKQFLQLHILTPYPVSNPNRDDAGLPKTAMFGGVVRARKSSQHDKRRARISEDMQKLGKEKLGIRTKHVGDLVSNYLTDKGIAKAAAVNAARQIVTVLENKKAKPEDAKKSTGKKGKAGKEPEQQLEQATLDVVTAPDAPADTDEAGMDMGQLVFLSRAEIGRMQTAAEALVNGGPVPKYSDLLLHADTAVDVGMFGRMMTATPEFNREAAVQVSHAVTTHKATVEDDYFSAVDDFNKRTDSGAAHIGERAFISGIFCQYVCVDLELLVKNLAGNGDLAKTALVALVRGLMTASSGGMSASYASRTYAEFVLAELSDTQPFTGVTAFDKAVFGNDLLTASIQRLREHRGKMKTRYELIKSIEEFEFAPDNDKTIGDLLAFIEGAFKKGEVE